MANICFTSVVAEGNPAELTRLFNVLNDLSNDDYCVSLSKVVESFGGGDVYAKGYINGWQLNSDESALYFNTESAWAEPYETLAFLKSVLPSLSFFYVAEEPNCNYFVTNDQSRKFFEGGRFAIKLPEEDDRYFDTEDERKAFVEGLIGKSIESNDEVEVTLNAWAKDNGISYVDFYEYEYLDRVMDEYNEKYQH